MTHPPPTGALIRAARLAAGYSQRQLARAAKLSRNNLRKFEQAKAEPNAWQLKRILVAIGVEV